MQKNSITNKITPCCGLPFSVIYWWVSNLTLNSEADRQFIISKISQGGIISIDAWKILINSGTLEADASLTKAEFLAWFDCGRQPSCEQFKLIIEGYKIGNYDPMDEYGVGWTEVYILEEYNNKLIKKITDYVGGVGVLPDELSNRIGFYLGDEILTDNKDLAIDFRGKNGANGTAEIPDWQPQNYVQKSLTITDNTIWRVADGQTAGVGDVPGVSAKWKSLGSDDEDVRIALKWFLEQQSGGTEFLDKTFEISNIASYGNLYGIANNPGKLLSKTGALVSFSEAGTYLNVWQNIPTKANGIKKIIAKLRPYGNSPLNPQNANIIGTKSNGDVIPLVMHIGDTPPSTLQTYELDITEYESISVGLAGIDSIPNTLNQTIEFYKVEGGQNLENSVKNYIDENGGSGGGKIISENLLMIDKPTSAPIINIVGELPTDASPTRTPTNIEFEYIMNNRIVFKCKSTLAIQGNATATFAKKGFETAFKNYNDTELKVQFGEWAAFSEFHLKAYPNDQTFARDLTAGKLWHQIRKNNEFPKSYIADFNGGKLVDSNKENLQEQSLFYTEGFPVEFRLNGDFYGIYILRMKKDSDNYMMNNANDNHIFIDNEEGVNWTTFTPSNWKLRSPKVSGGFTNTVLLGKMNRWWDWFRGINDNTIDFESTVENYLNIESWVDDIILQQVTAHWDYQVNNILLTSWDGLKLSICYYDGDQTFGFVLGSMGGFGFPLTVDSNGLYWRSDFWRGKLYPKLLSRIKTRYTELRNNKILNSNNVYQLFKETTDMIPRDLYEKEMNAWRLVRPDEGIHNVRYCMNWFKERLVKLDLIWKL